MWNACDNQSDVTDHCFVLGEGFDGVCVLSCMFWLRRGCISFGMSATVPQGIVVSGCATGSFHDSDAFMALWNYEEVRV